MGWLRRKEHDEEQLSAYLDGELNPREAAAVERHLSTCDACAALLEELRSTQRLLSALPAQTPRRSFVLGAEHARAPVQDVARPRRLGLALAPAAALSVFVALLFVDLTGDTSRSADESTNTMIAASSARETDDASAGAGSATDGDAAGASEESTFEADAMVDSATGEAAPEAPADPQGATAAAGAAEVDEGSALRSGGPEQAPDEGEAAITAADEEPLDEGPAPEPLVQESPEDDGGISTLRILQVVAGVAFLASGFYVFVWPRVSRGGSER